MFLSEGTVAPDDQLKLTAREALAMSFATLTTRDLAVVLACLRASVEGPFFEDWEFHTLFGITRQELKAVADNWPPADNSDRNVQLAVNNSLANLLHYPHGRGKTVEEMVGVPVSEITRVYQVWRSTRT